MQKNQTVLLQTGYRSVRVVIHRLQDRFLTGLGYDQLVTGHNWLFKYTISTTYSNSNIKRICSFVCGRKRVKRGGMWCKHTLAVVLGRVQGMEETCGGETPPHIILNHVGDTLREAAVDVAGIDISHTC
jgi:hypothetical protein